MKYWRNIETTLHRGWCALWLVSAIVMLYLPDQTLAAGSDPDPAARMMLKRIETDFQQTGHYIGDTPLSDPIKQVLLQVPRHEFVPAALKRYAYENRPLPIGYGQTISQPYIVALMTALLLPEAGDRILEIGTGSGYQAAVLSPLVSEVYSIEIIKPLAISAEQRLRRLGYNNIRTRLSDGYYGWPDKAPFDGIVVTAAASQVPPPLIRQLRNGGRMVIPVGGRFMTQQLLLIEKDHQGQIQTRQLLPVRFVPLTGRH